MNELIDNIPDLNWTLHGDIWLTERDFFRFEINKHDDGWMLYVMIKEYPYDNTGDFYDIFNKYFETIEDGHDFVYQFIKNKVKNLVELKDD